MSHMGFRHGLTRIMFIALFAPWTASLAESARPLSTGAPSASYLVKLTLGLLLVLALFMALAWFARRAGLGGMSGKGADSLHIIASLSLGARDRLVLVKAGEQQLLLSVTPGKIRKLHVLDDDITDPTGEFAHTFEQQRSKA